MFTEFTRLALVFTVVGRELYFVENERRRCNLFTDAVSQKTKRTKVPEFILFEKIDLPQACILQFSGITKLNFQRFQNVNSIFWLLAGTIHRKPFPCWFYWNIDDLSYPRLGAYFSIPSTNTIPILFKSIEFFAIHYGFRRKHYRKNNRKYWTSRTYRITTSRVDKVFALNGRNRV